MTATRYKTALLTLRRHAGSLSKDLGCTARQCQIWAHEGPPDEVLRWVEALAHACAKIPPPKLTFSRGRPKKL